MVTDYNEFKSMNPPFSMVFTRLDHLFRPTGDDRACNGAAVTLIQGKSDSENEDGVSDTVAEEATFNSDTKDEDFDDDMVI